MRLLPFLKLLIIGFLCTTKGFSQDKLYFSSGDKDGKTESLTQSSVTYTTTGKKPAPITTSTKKLQLLFNKSGDFLAFDRLDFTNERSQQAISHFISGTDSREKDQLYTLNRGRIDDRITSEDKNFIYLQTSGDKLDKKQLVAIIYKDGHHTLYVSAEKAAPILWDNRPSTTVPVAAKNTETKQEPEKIISTPAKKDTVPASVNTPQPVSAPVTSAPPANTQSADKPALKFEDVAGNVSKAEFERKALQKTNQLNIYLKVICDKSANYEEINKAIDQSMTLFVNENAMIETSSLARNDVKRYKVRSYLSHIKLVNYDKIEIEWTNVQYVSDMKQGPDGNYYGVVSFEQVFRGYRDGKLVYQDVTRKNTTVVLKTYEKITNGDTRNVWDVLLSDIGVISTKPL